MMKSAYRASPRWWDPLAALLMLVALIVAANRLASTGWTDHLERAYLLAFLGLAAGLALGQSRFSAAWAAFFAAVYGLFSVPWQLGLTLGEGILWSERMISLAGRLNLAILLLIKQQPVRDPLLFLLLMFLLFWALSLYAGYSLTRRADPWRATLPAGLALLIIHAYDPGRRFGLLELGAYFLFVLLVVARLAYLGNRARWRQGRVHTPPETAIDLSQAAAIAAVALVILAWTAPAITSAAPPAQHAWQRVSRPWLAARNYLSNAFVSLKASFGVISDYYGETLDLGRGNTLSDDVVLRVEAPADPPAGVRYYWRAWAYDQYETGRWSSRASTEQAVTPREFEVSLPQLDKRWEAEFSFSSLLPISTLYAAPQPVWASRPVRLLVAPNADGVTDLASLRAAVPLFGGETYGTRSSLSAATEADLRGAGTDYPGWVLERYLQLPRSISPRTRGLAFDLAAGRDNPYDVAVAVTNYLRDNIAYADLVPPQPTNREPIDWFLFEYQRGFCNYYATAEVILLRSLGIPARLSVGYAQGERQLPVAPDLQPELGELPETVTYLVRQRDAHAWPEVYFPGYGWVEFEPTASQAPIQRATGVLRPGAGAAERQGEGDSDARDPREALPPGAEAGATGAAVAGLAGRLRPLLLWLAPIPAAILLYVAWRVRYPNRPLPVVMEQSLRRIGVAPPAALRRWARRAAFSPLERAYHELNSALARVGARPQPCDTPAERAASLGRALPASEGHAWTVVAEYQAAAYGPRGGDAVAAGQAAGTIRWLSWQAAARRFVESLRGRRVPHGPQREWRL